MLRELAGPEVCNRGGGYYEQNCVVPLEHTALAAAAEAERSFPYRINLSLTEQGLRAECTCPAMTDHGFCRHAVAFGLFLIDAPPLSAVRTTGKQRHDIFSNPDNGF